jgi:hypothetical protein
VKLARLLLTRLFFVWFLLVAHVPHL